MNYKIKYGIDLGTTNSSVAKIYKGNLKIYKSDQTLKDTMPSCVHFTRRQKTLVGDEALQSYERHLYKSIMNDSADQIENINSNFFLEFKRTMGTDKVYYCSNMDRNYSSEELSAQVLNKLLRFIHDDTKVESAVITVPARFRQNQIDATQRAAHLAGLKYCELLQEPIAASLAYGVNVKEINGYWLVFDMGGGTFDIALMRLEDGIMKVVDTEGDNHLGGKDLDFSIVDNVLIPHLKENYVIDELISNPKKYRFLRKTLKWYAERAKISLSTMNEIDIYSDNFIGIDDNGIEIELDLTLTYENFIKVTAPIVNRTIKLTKNIIKDNNISIKDVDSIILVGGSTLSPAIRDRLHNEFHTFINSKGNPLTAVAEGASLFAASKEIPRDLQQRDKEKLQLDIKYPETTIEEEELVGLKILRDLSEKSFPRKLKAQLVESFQDWKSDLIPFENEACLINVPLSLSKANNFNLKIYDEESNLVRCEPNEFTIIQGVKVAKATLPYTICIETYDHKKRKEILKPVKGLFKNTTLPAKGVKKMLYTQKELNPGNLDDFIKIPVFEGEPDTRAILNEKAADIFIKGTDVSQKIPIGSEVHIKAKVDSSRRIHLSAFFPDFNENVIIPSIKLSQKVEKIKKLSEQIDDASKFVYALGSKYNSTVDMNKVTELSSEIKYLKGILDKGGTEEDSRTKVQERIKTVWKGLDKMKEANEWPKIERALVKSFDKLKKTNRVYGNKRTTKSVKQLEQHFDNLLTRKDINLGRSFLMEVQDLGYNIIKKHKVFWISILKGFNKSFYQYEWKNLTKAQELVNTGLNISQDDSQESLENLELIVKTLYKLIPKSSDQNILDFVNIDLLQS